MNKKSKVRKRYRFRGVRPHTIQGAFRVDWYDWQGCRCTKVVYGTEAEAARYRRERITEADQIKNGLRQIPESKKIISLQELWDEFRTQYQLKVDSMSIEQGSLDRYDNSIHAFFDYDPSLSHKPINSFTVEDFERFKIFRKDNGFSPEGINTNLRNLRTIFQFAISEGLLRKSAIHSVSPMKTVKNDVRYLSEDELKRLNKTLQHLDITDTYQKDVYDLTKFFLYTGARTREALYPTFVWSCIKDQKIIFPKTKSSVSRTIPLTNSVNTVLESRKLTPGGPFHFTRDMVYNRTKFAFTAAKIENASTHTLRKTAGAYYYVSTRDIFATSKFLGHSSVKVTESYYAGLIQSLKTEYSMSFDKKLTDMLVSDVLYVCYSNTINDHSIQYGIS